MSEKMIQTEKLTKSYGAFTAVDQLNLSIGSGILFGFIDAQLSDGAKLAVARAKKSIFQPDWKKVFDPENVMKEVKAITQSRSAAK